MNYLGSKKRLGKHLLPFILPHLKGRHYVEPFVGGGNMMAHIPHDAAESRTGYDASVWAIRALRMIRDRADELPRDNAEFTKEMYEEIRAGKDTYPDKQFAAYVLFACSFGGKFADSWAKRTRDNYDYVGASYRSCTDQSRRLKGVRLMRRHFQTIELKGPSVIYCDPPYANTTGYKDTSEFPHEYFWEWADELAEQGHVVFVSEYSAPEWVGDPVFEKQHRSRVQKGAGLTRVEKLFRL